MPKKKVVPPNEEYLEAKLKLSADLLASALLANNEAEIRRNLFRLTVAGMELDKRKREDLDGNAYIL